MKPTKAQIRTMLKKLNTLSCKESQVRQKFNLMCEEYYGEENYSDHDKDWIIDCLDCGNGMIPFEEFDEIMKEINSQDNE